MAKKAKKRQEVHYYTFDELFTACGSFEVPGYQRGYAWDEDNVNELKNDIIGFIDNKNTTEQSPEEYYTGTIVLIKRGEGKSKFFEIVDGQQRLTSIIILIKTLCDILKEEHAINKDVTIRKYILDKKGKSPRFKPNIEMEDFFKKYIIKGKSSTKTKIFSHDKLENARKIFYEWLKEEDKNYLNAVLRTITNKLKFIVFMPPLDTAGMMFETINDRGVHLSELEKIKNYFLYIAAFFGETELREDITDNWGKMLMNLKSANVKDIRGEDDFLRYVYFAFFQNARIQLKRDEKLYDEFKNGVFSKDAIQDNRKHNIENMQNFVSFLGDSAEHYAYLYNKNYRDDEPKIRDFKKTIRYLRCHKQHAAVMPLYLSIMARSDKGKAELLDVLEKLNFRLYVLRFAGRRFGRKKISQLASKYHHKEIDADELKKGMIKLISEKTSLEKIENKFKETWGWYGWPGIRYFLGRYEEFLRGDESAHFDVERVLYEENKETEEHEQKNSRFTLEHIWALRNQPKKYSMFHVEKNRLGNLVLMGEEYNNDLANKDILVKIDHIRKYHKVPFLQVQQLIEIIDTKEIQDLISETKGPVRLSKAINNIREARLRKFAMNAWKVDGE